MIYHLSLIAGLEITERYPHSIDIYEEHLRFTPLGADATVVWGFKDLRLYNPHPFPIVFQFKLQAGSLIGEIHTTGGIERRTVEFKRVPLDKKTNLVNTLVNGKIVATNVYEHKPG